jgi:transcriptional regulator with XRE-family HTH domain
VTSAEPLGCRLSQWRATQQMSLAAAGRLFGVHPTTYRRWEAGRRPYTRQLRAIAQVLDVDLAEVTALAGPPHHRPGRPAPADASVLMRARVAAGMNRVDLGRTLHVGPATVYRWERGGTRPPADLLPGLARLLGLTREQLDSALIDHPPYRHDGETLPGLGAALRARGWSRADVQQLLGVSTTTVFEWETGRTRIPAWALRRLAAAIDIEVDDIVSDGRTVPRPQAQDSALATLRRRVRMTQKEAAHLLGVSPSSLGRFESGRRSVNLSLARRMARAYHAPLSTVLSAAGSEPPAVSLA